GDGSGRLKNRPHVTMVSGPETRITEIPPRPGGVASAAIVSPSVYPVDNINVFSLFRVENLLVRKIEPIPVTVIEQTNCVCQA
ncbi:MAG: hypothetical protein P9M15_07275, partial [Candidatus Electryoneaceae bacterium]|nr:hypothetical protein [Candidatus Electryoneaceae bacterium]